jgi:hypothetical protein
VSEQEQDALILKIVKDARVARQELVLLREKAHSICDAMDAVLTSLRHAIGPIASSGNRAHVDLTEAFDRIPNGPEIRDLCEKLKAATERDADLAKRKEQLGL